METDSADSRYVANNNADKKSVIRDAGRRPPFALKGPPIAELSKRRELGTFLRSKRRRLDPNELGLQARRRRTPGPSREEVAYLAGISADWYGRLEGGRESNPSRATLQAIANVLRLTDPERAFAFALVGLADPRSDVPTDDGKAYVLDRLIFDPLHLALCVGDQYLTPIKWNAIADAWWGLSDIESPAERNFVSRFDDPYIMALGGDEYETMSRAIVGMFRRAHVSAPTPFSQQILDVAMRKPAFRRLWDEHGISDQAWESGGPHARVHPAVGPVRIKTLQLSLPLAPEIIVAVAPDEASVEAFDRLREIGRDSRFLPALSARDSN
jgi:transcriptional regulator with XRE-family HTH domain